MECTKKRREEKRKKNQPVLKLHLPSKRTMEKKKEKTALVLLPSSSQ
jgi:hypothetical protein